MRTQNPPIRFFARPSSRWWRLTASYSCPCWVRRRWVRAYRSFDWSSPCSLGLLAAALRNRHGSVSADMGRVSPGSSIDRASSRFDFQIPAFLLAIGSALMLDAYTLDHFDLAFLRLPDPRVCARLGRGPFSHQPLGLCDGGARGMRETVGLGERPGLFHFSPCSLTCTIRYGRSRPRRPMS